MNLGQLERQGGTVRHCLALGLLLIVGMAGSVWGQTLPVCDFVLPQSQFSTLSLGGNYHQFNDRYRDNRSNAMVGNLGLSGLAWAEGPEWSYRVSGSARVRLTVADVTLDYNLESSSQLRRYLNENLFVFGGADTAGLPGRKGLNADALAGAGWGRYRDVTPLAKALRISQLLQKQGVLSQAPSEEKLKELAQLIGRQRELGLEGVLKEIEKNLGVQFNVSAVLALQEALMMLPTRSCGWDVSLSLGYTLIDPRGQHDALLRAEANYASALDPDTELVANARWRAPLPLTDTSTLTGSVSLHRTLSATAELALLYGLQRIQDSGKLTETHSLDMTLRIQVQAGASIALEGKVSTGTGYEELEWSFDVSFKYDLF